MEKLKILTFLEIKNLQEVGPPDVYVRSLFLFYYLGRGRKKRKEDTLGRDPTEYR